MPDGSSSAAPVITPGPSDFKSNRVHRTGANVGTKELERKPPQITARSRSQSYMVRRTDRIAQSGLMCSDTRLRHLYHEV
jgi:hypothetical protein